MARIVTLTPNPAYDVSVETPRVEANRKLQCAAPMAFPGGGGINVSRAARRLGADTLAIHAAGGPFGGALSAMLEKEEVETLAVPVAGETRIAFAVRETETGAEYRFGLPGPEMESAEAEALLEAASRTLAPDNFLIGSGSLPPGAPDDFWARAAKIARNAGARFILDTTKGEAEALREGLFLVRKNKHEVASLAGRALAWPDEAAAFAQDFVRTGNVERLVVTHGGDGAIMASKDGFVRAPGFDVPVNSAVGAGDSFVAGLATALLRGDSDEAALRYAMACASATLMTPGTSLFDPAEVQRLYDGARS